MENHDIPRLGTGEGAGDQHLTVVQGIAHGGAVDLAQTSAEGEQDQHHADRKDKDLQIIKEEGYQTLFLFGGGSLLGLYYCIFCHGRVTP